jgi:hypothetical protein
MRKRICIGLLALSFIASLAAGAPACARPVRGEALTASPH